jgi:hypothetical protein
MLAPMRFAQTCFEKCHELFPPLRMASSFFPDHTGGGTLAGRAGPQSRGPGAHALAGFGRVRKSNAVEEILEREALVQSARDLRVPPLPATRASAPTTPRVPAPAPTFLLPRAPRER